MCRSIFDCITQSICLSVSAWPCDGHVTRPGCAPPPPFSRRVGSRNPLIPNMNEKFGCQIALLRKLKKKGIWIIINRNENLLFDGKSWTHRQIPYTVTAPAAFSSCALWMSCRGGPTNKWDQQLLRRVAVDLLYKLSLPSLVEVKLVHWQKQHSQSPQTTCCFFEQTWRLPPTDDENEELRHSLLSSGVGWSRQDFGSAASAASLWSAPAQSLDCSWKGRMA